MYNKISDEDMISKKLLNARNNIIKMMDYRGYEISNIPIISEKEIKILERIK